jgi:hypothetical protein
MTALTQTPFEAFLNDHDEEAWSATLTTLLRSIHEVDRNATQIWFAFYPLSLFRALQTSGDPETLASRLLLQGKYYLRDQINSSHTFLYGHRFWPQVKEAVQQHAKSIYHRRQAITRRSDHRGGAGRESACESGSIAHHRNNCCRLHDAPTSRIIRF